MLGKTSLVAAVRARLPELTADQAGAVVDALFVAIAERLARGEPVTIPGLGTFALIEQDVVLIAVPPGAAVKAATRSPASVAKLSDATGGASPTDRFVRSRPPERGLAFSTPAGEPSTYAVVEVFYATDRKATGATEPAEVFGFERSDGGALAYGRCRVSIPADHRIGHLEKPSLWHFELRADPEKHVVLLSVERQDHDGFLAALAARVRAAERREMLVFVHGFNVTFEDAARRTAQIAYDLQFDGAAAFYSWPSRGSKLAYTRDENSVEWTKPHLASFLQELARDSGAERIHLVAHSMGNRALASALQRIALTMGAGPGAPRFHEVVLTAPDVDAEVFRDLAREMMPVARRMTLYASGQDEALRLSHGVHGYPRAGDVDPEIVVVPGLDSVDASAVDTSFLGHSYFGDERSVISDLLLLLRNGLGPGERGLRSRRIAAGEFWFFPP